MASGAPIRAVAPSATPPAVMQSGVSWPLRGSRSANSVAGASFAPGLQAVVANGHTGASDVTAGMCLLDALPDPRYRLRHALALTIHRTPEYYWVAPDDFVLHGAGPSLKDAIEDYGFALVEYFEDLRRNPARLAPHLLEHLRYLETLIVEA